MGLLGLIYTQLKICLGHSLGKSIRYSSSHVTPKASFPTAVSPHYTTAMSCPGKILGAQHALSLLMSRTMLSSLCAFSVLDSVQILLAHQPTEISSCRQCSPSTMHVSSQSTPKLHLTPYCNYRLHEFGSPSSLSSWGRHGLSHL